MNAPTETIADPDPRPWCDFEVINATLFHCQRCGKNQTVSEGRTTTQVHRRCGKRPPGLTHTTMAPPQNPIGPGDFLHVLIVKWVGAGPGWNCGCSEHIAEMNREGPAGCRNRLEEMTDWLVKQAKEFEWVSVTIAGRIGRWLAKYPSTKPVLRTACRQMVLRAIRLSERAERVRLITQTATAQDQFDKAQKNGKYLAMFCRIEGTKILCEWTTSNYPTCHLPKTQQLITAEIGKVK